MTTLTLQSSRTARRLIGTPRSAAEGFASYATADDTSDVRRPWVVSASTLAAVAVAGAMATSSIVFSEPAIADVLMAAVVVGLPMLGVLRFGPATLLNLALWLIFVACGLAVCALSTTLGSAVVHQIVTLFLALGAFVLAGYVAADPIPRFRLIMTFYVVACLLAAAAALTGYFRLVPATYEIFTNYGRARGTFKDPNVLGAALAPAIVYLAWVALRHRPRQALIAALVGLPLCLALLLSFSRGAWASVAFSLLVAIWLALVTTRRSSDLGRFLIVAAIGTATLGAALSTVVGLDGVEDLFRQRASLDQSYDSGPDGRFGGQAKALGLILENPVGIGTHTFRDTYHSEEAHNVYLSQYLNAGWLGGTLYLISVFGTVAAGFYAIRRRTALQGPLIVATASFAGLAFEGFVIDTDHWRHFFIVMALIWGLVDAQAPTHDHERRNDD